MRWSIIALLALACTPEYDLDPPDERCEVIVQETIPRNGAEDVYHRTAIEFRLDGSDPSAEVLADVPGVTEVLDGGSTVAFVPDAPLEPEAYHSFTLDYCGGVPTIGFTTSEAGLPLDAPPYALVGRAWDIDLASGRFTDGEVIARLVASLFDDHLLVGVVDADARRLALRFAAPLGDEQDLCGRTVDLDAVDFSRNPYFQFQTSELWFPAFDTHLALLDVAATGTFAPDATYIAGITWAGMIDGRDLLALVNADDTRALCDVAESAGMACEPCPTDGAPFCLAVTVEDVEAVEVPGLTLEPVAEPDAHPECGIAVSGG